MLQRSIVVLGALVLFHPLAVAQEPELFQRAKAELARHDTTAALAALRQLTDERSDFAPGWGLLGEVLTARASSVATDFQDRRAAEKALNRALELDHDNPLYLFTLGRLKRKQQIYLDSRRLIDQAIDRLEEGKGDLDPSNEAELYFQRGLFYEDEYLDTRHLVFAPNLPVGASPECTAAPTFCMNFLRPEEFNEQLRAAEDLSEFAEDDYERMSRAFESALRADPTHAGAFRRQAIHRIDRGDLVAAESLARSYVERAPESPWGYLTLGLIHHRSARDSLAEAEFDRGISLANPEIASHYRDVSTILRPEQSERYSEMNEVTRRQLEEVLWRKSDPLYLSSENEVRVAHLARVAYADLMFEDPSEGVWGSETERGVLYVRYGPPQRIFKLRRDTDRELTESDVAAALSGGGSGQTGGGGVGGRWILWNYDWDLPNFVFGKLSRWRHTTHLDVSYSATFDQELRKVQPAIYGTEFDLHSYPAQVARFRGEGDSIIELDLYSEIPIEKLVHDLEIEIDSIGLGLFLFAGTDYQRVYERSLSVPAGDGRDSVRALTYSLPLPPGRFSVSLEAQAGEEAAAVYRESVELVAFPDGQLAVSDLLLAHTVTPKGNAPSGRRDFAIRVNRTLRYEPLDPFAVYWEVYGLTPDEEGLARYRVTLSVEDAEGQGVLARVVGALGGLVGLSGEESPELSFERTAELRGDRIPEYMSLELALEEAGNYRLNVEVTDQVSGATAVSERVFEYLGEPEG